MSEEKKALIKHMLFAGILLLGHDAMGGDAELPGIDIPVVCCPLLNSAPAIDGKLDDPAWETAQVMPRFPEDPLMSEEASMTRVYLGYDGGGLYLGYRCEEKNMAGLVAKVTGNGGPIWADDSVEVMLDGRATGAGAFHLLFNANGVFFGQTREKGGWKNEFSGKLEISAQKGKDYWIVEVKLPFESLGGTPKPGEIWRVNFTRMRLAGKAQHLGAWYPTRSFVLVEDTGFLCFTDGPVVLLTPAGAQKIGFGKNELKGRVRSTGKANLRLRAQVWRDGENKSFLSEPVVFESAGEKDVALMIDVPWRGKIALAADIVDNPTGRILYRLPNRALEIPQRLALDGLLPCYYQDEDYATVHVRFNMPEKDLAEIAKSLIGRDTPGYVLHMVLREIVLAPGAEGERLPPEPGVRQPFHAEHRWISYFPESAGIFGAMAYSGVFRVRNLPEGTYGLKVRLLHTTAMKSAKWEQGGHKEELETVAELPEEVFYVIPPAAIKLEPVKEVTIGKEGEIRVNGKIFFPLGLYWPAVEYFPAYARHGFNLMEAPMQSTPEKCREMLDKAQKAGVYAMVTLAENFVYDHEGTFVPRALEMAQGVKSHPAILLYAQPDEVLYYSGDSEPVMNKCLQLYKGIKEIDPTRLVYLTTTDGPFYNPEGSRDILGKHTRISDVMGPDRYSIGWSPIYDYYDFARLISDLARPLGKTSIFCTQGHTIRNTNGSFRWPTLKELRLHAYLVLMGGSKGIFWYKARGLWGEVGLQDNPKAWAYMKKLNAELIALTEVLGAPAGPEGLAVTPSDGVKTWHRALGKKHFVFVANVDKVKKELAMTFPGVPQGTMIDVHGEYRSLTADAGEWRDHFAPLEVHVYVLVIN